MILPAFTQEQIDRRRLMQGWKFENGQWTKPCKFCEVYKPANKQYFVLKGIKSLTRTCKTCHKNNLKRNKNEK